MILLYANRKMVHAPSCNVRKQRQIRKKRHQILVADSGPQTVDTSEQTTERDEERYRKKTKKIRGPFSTYRVNSHWADIEEIKAQNGHLESILWSPESTGKGPKSTTQQRVKTWANIYSSVFNNQFCTPFYLLRYRANQILVERSARFTKHP